jgi:hypothetical protein
MKMKIYIVLFGLMFSFINAVELFSQDMADTKHKTVMIGDELKMVCNNLNDIAKVQWFKDGSLLNGQTGDRLVFSSAKLSDAGKYHAVVEGVCGVTKTNDMVVRVEIPSQPGVETAVAGGDFLFQYDPNPAGDLVRFKFNLSVASDVRLILSDAFGNQVAVLFEGYAGAGFQNIEFSASDNNLANGVYFYTLMTNSFKDTKSMILMR